MRLTIACSKIKKRNLVLINNDINQRETLSERPIRPPLICIERRVRSNFSQEFLKKTFGRDILEEKESLRTVNTKCYD